MKTTYSILVAGALIIGNISAFASKPNLKESASEIYTLAKSSGQDNRDVKNFNGVAAGGPIQVIVTIGASEGLKFEGDAEAIATLVAEIKGNILIIRPKTSWTSWSHKYENKKIIARVSAKTLLV